MDRYLHCNEYFYIYVKKFFKRRIRNLLFDWHTKRVSIAIQELFLSLHVSKINEIEQFSNDKKALHAVSRCNITIYFVPSCTSIVY